MMETETRKRIIWFAVFMVWLGIITSFYLAKSQMSEQYATNNKPTQSATAGTQISIEKQTIQEGSSVKNISPDVQANKEQKDESKNLLTEYRLNREKGRSQQINTWRDIVNNPNSDPTIKKQVQEELLTMTKRNEQELEIEGLIRVAGFEDAFASINENSINLIIQSDGLTQEEVAKIGDIVIRVTNCRFEDINIMEYSVPKGN